MFEALKRWLTRRGAATVLSFRLNLTPVTASRPRVPRFGKPYYPAKYHNWRVDAAGCLKKLDLPKAPPGPLVTLVEHVVPRPKTRKKAYPRGDVDNYAKATLDALTHAELWDDDDQVEVLVATKRYAAEDEEPHAHVVVLNAPIS